MSFPAYQLFGLNNLELHKTYTMKNSLRPENILLLLTFNPSLTTYQPACFWNQMWCQNYQRSFTHIKMVSRLDVHVSKYSWTSGCDHLFSATSFPKYQKFPSLITISGTSCKRPEFWPIVVYALDILGDRLRDIWLDYIVGLSRSLLQENYFFRREDGFAYSNVRLYGC